MGSSGASGFVPSVAEVEAYKERPPILATIELVDGSALAEVLPITPDLNVEKVLEICNHFLEVKDDRKKHFGMFVVDEEPIVRAPAKEAGTKGGDDGDAPPPPPPAAWDLPRTPAPLKKSAFMGDIYVNRRRQ